MECLFLGSSLLSGLLGGGLLLSGGLCLGSGLLLGGSLLLACSCCLLLGRLMFS